jgi:hypothetical protein
MERSERLIYGLLAVFLVTGGLGRFLSPVRWLLGVAGTALIAAAVAIVEQNRFRD